MQTTCCAEPPAPTLAQVTAEPAYATTASELIQAVASAADEAEAVTLLSQAARCLGAESSAFVSFIRDDGSHESFRFLLACDPVWCHEYQRRAWYAHDPWLQYALAHSEPALVSNIPLGSGKQRELEELARHYGFASGLIVPAPSATSLSRVGVLCLGSSREGYFEAGGLGPLRIAARSLAMELHDWWIGRIKGELLANAGLTEEDLALLRWERRGLGTKAIASTLNTTTGAVDSRFQRLNQKLGVPNRRAAATLAAEYGLV
jgi:DNA-binding CsgD family transcriptional regulator